MKYICYLMHFLGLHYSVRTRILKTQYFMSKVQFKLNKSTSLYKSKTRCQSFLFPFPLGFHPCDGGRGKKIFISCFPPFLIFQPPHFTHMYFTVSSSLHLRAKLDLVFEKSSMSKLSGYLDDAVFKRCMLDLGPGMKIRDGLASRGTETVVFEDDLCIFDSPELGSTYICLCHCVSSV